MKVLYIQETILVFIGFSIGKKFSMANQILRIILESISIYGIIPDCSDDDDDDNNNIDPSV
jgi:hypothetical protein